MMATFFGEILPVTSRAVDDDDDDEDDDGVTLTPQNDPAIYWTQSFCAHNENQANKKVPCKVFIIAVGMEANVFTDIYLKPFGYETIGRVSTSVDESTQTSSKEKTCYLFHCRSNPSVVLCQCKVDVLAEHSYVWANLLVNNFDLSAADIIVLASSGMSGYCSDLPFSDLETPLLRSLSTESFVGPVRCKTLEQPNMVYKYKAVVYVCFKEKRYMDISDIKAFIPVLQAAPIKDITEVNKNTDQMLRDIVKLHSLQDMMYM